LFKAPGIKAALTAFGAINQNSERCIELLNNGELIGIYPGK